MPFPRGKFLSSFSADFHSAIGPAGVACIPHGMGSSIPDDGRGEKREREGTSMKGRVGTRGTDRVRETPEEPSGSGNPGADGRVYRSVTRGRYASSLYEGEGG